MKDPFEHLRSLLNEEPTSASWARIVDLFESWPRNKERDVAISYAEAHLEDWPDDLRTFREANQKHPVWPLARHFELQSASQKYLKEVARFSHIVSLSGSVGRLKKLDGFAPFTHITSLDMSACMSVKNLEPIRELTQLKRLLLTGWGQDRIGDALKDLTQLKVET